MGQALPEGAPEKGERGRSARAECLPEPFQFGALRLLFGQLAARALELGALDLVGPDPAAEVTFVAAREGAAVWTAGTAGTAADTEHAGGSRSSRCRKCNTTTARRAHHLDRSRRRHMRTYWCS